MMHIALVLTRRALLHYSQLESIKQNGNKVIPTFECRAMSTRLRKNKQTALFEYA